VTLANAVANGAFDSGLSGWTTGGAVQPVAVSGKKVTHGGAGQAVLLGSTKPVAGDSTLAQTVAVPAGSSRLSFWYQPHCKTPRGSTANQFRVEIHSTGGATLASLLGACSKSGKWLPAAFDTSAYAGQNVVVWFDAVGGGAKGTSAYVYLDDIVVGTPAGGNAVSDGDFESGLGAWTPSGVPAPTIGPPGHTGADSARLGDGGAFAGNSTLSQTVIVPSGSPLLTVWYQPHCEDTIAFDQIQVQIRTTGGTIKATPLSVCADTTKWTKAEVPLADYAGQQVVIALTVHDDGNTADPTWAYFDDVSLS
jgi:hypothetical protein